MVITTTLASTWIGADAATALEIRSEICRITEQRKKDIALRNYIPALAGIMITDAVLVSTK